MYAWLRRRPRQCSIVSQLARLVLTAVVPLLVFTAVLVFLLAAKEGQAVDRGLRETARALTIAVDRELLSTVGTLEALAVSRSLHAGNWPIFYDHARRVRESQARYGWLTISLSTPSGRQIINLRRPLGASLPDDPDPESLTRAVQSRAPTIGDLVIGTVTLQPRFGVRVPVLQDGVVRYVLTAVISPRALGEVLAAQNAPPGWVGGIIDRRGTILARTIDADRRIGQPGSADLRAAAARSAEGVSRGLTVDRRRVSSGFSHSTMAGWIVAIGAPTETVDAAFSRGLWLLGGGGLLLTLLALGAAMISGRRIASAITSLSAVANGIARGEAAGPRRPTTVREVETVAAAFQEAHALLESRAAEIDAARREAQDRRREAEIIAELSAAINASLNLDAILERVTARARELCRSDDAAILLREREGNAFVPRYNVGDRAPKSEALRVTRGQGLGGEVLASGRPVRTADYAHDSRIGGDSLEAARSEGMMAAMAAPIRIRGRIDGLLYVINHTSRPFTDRDEAVLVNLTEHAGVALHNAELLAAEQRARTDAESANRTKDEFLAMLSHELRTPLNAVYGWARLLRSGDLDEQASTRAVEVIERNARAQAQLIDDLLDVSRIVTGKLRLDVRPVDLPLIVERAVESVRPAAAAKELRLQVILDPQAGPVTGDPDRLQQVVWNLVMNAVKFTAKRGRIQVTVQRVNSHVEIRVSDTGSGIREDLLPVIFDRFRQGDSTSTRAHGGLGLGLALVRHLVELHGGSVRAESPGEGKGATFIVKLPLAILEPLDELERMPSTARQNLGRDRGAILDGVKVVIVDDDRDSLELLGTMLSRSGAEVRTSTSAPQALEILADWRADVLVCDIEMPDEDGYSLIRKLRALGGTQGGATPAVAVTAYGRAEDRMRSLAAGFNLHVSKPADPGEMVIVVASLAGRIRAD